jgi:hypothetical protein
MAKIMDPWGHRLNHVELVYRPGERELAKKIFEVLGFLVTDTGGPYINNDVDPSNPAGSNNVVYASEVTPQQWAFEQQLQQSIASGGEIASSFEAFQENMREAPYLSTHFGIRLSQEEMEATVARVEALNAPELEGRVSVSARFGPGSLTPTLQQAWVKTDVFAAGLITVGQHIELQADTKS